MRPNQEPRVAGEISMTRDSTELHAKIHSRLDARRRSRTTERERTFRHADRDETDIVRVRRDGDAAAIVESDIELSRQSVEVALIENVVMQRLREGSHIDQFIRI